MASINRRLFLSLAALFAPGSAFAHHGWGGYDTSKSFTVTGITQFRRNPWKPRSTASCRPTTCL